MNKNKTKRLSNRLSKKILCSKKLNNDNDNEIIDDNDSDFYCISIIIKLKNIIRTFWIFKLKTLG